MIIENLVLRKSQSQKDSAAKSIYKSISWRVLGTLDTIAISYMLTGKLQLAFSIGGVEVFTKLFLYYLHERLWNKLA